MKLIFVSNYFNHHQLPFCDALYELLEGDFCFLQTQPMEEERVKMGWQAEERPYVRYAAKNSCAHKSGVEKTPGSESNNNAVTDAEEFEKLLFTADVVIFGGCDEESYIQERLTAGKPIFRYNERLYKEGQWKAVSPRGLLQKYKDHTRYRKAPVYFLCAGAYVPCDYHLIHAYPGKMLRFGYFPETRHYEAGQPFNHKEPGSILWAARMIDWKHPELVVKTASYLKEYLEENTFHITMIGGGELEEETHRLAEELGVTDVITFPGFQGPEEVRAAMEKSEIYLVTSDRKEGWGAVVNEAMNSGCAVVASDAAGATPYLVNDGVNGSVYHSGNIQELYEKVRRLLENTTMQYSFGKAAYQTITELWNAEVAAKRFLQLSQTLLNGTDASGLFANGPCSPAKPLREDWYQR